MSRISGSGLVHPGWVSVSSDSGMRLRLHWNSSREEVKKRWRRERISSCSVQARVAQAETACSAVRTGGTVNRVRPATVSVSCGVRGAGGDAEEADVGVGAGHGDEGEGGGAVDHVHHAELLLLFGALLGVGVLGLVDAEGVDPEVAVAHFFGDGDGVFDGLGQGAGFQSSLGRHHASPDVAEGEVVAVVRIGVDHPAEGVTTRMRLISGGFWISQNVPWWFLQFSKACLGKEKSMSGLTSLPFPIIRPGKVSEVARHIDSPTIWDCLIPLSDPIREPIM